MPVRRQFDADPAVVRRIRTFVRQEAERRSFSQEAEDIVLAVSEACTNVVLHAGSDHVEVRITWGRDSFEVEVADQGVFGTETHGAGLGLPLMRGTMDVVTVREGTPDVPGTRVRMTKLKRGPGTYPGE